MHKNGEVWKQYKQAILNKVGDFTVLFERLEEQRSSTDSWVTARCPFHHDRNPSFAFNRETGQWCCFAGCGKGSAFDFVMHDSGKGFKETLTALGDRFGVPRPMPKRPASNGSTRPAIREQLVQQWVKYLWANEEVVRWLREKRGLADATLKKHDIGWDPKRQRNTIPIRDERGNVVNVRLYNAKKDGKMINYTEGRHKYGTPPRLYGVDELVKYEGKQVILCEGEWDRLLLQQEGFIAVTGTHGASTFRPEWVSHFKDKDAVLLYDCDAEGQAAARTILQAFKAASTTSVRNVLLPLRGSKDDKDVTDYLHKRGMTGADLLKLIDDTPPHSYAQEEKSEEIVELESFTHIERKEVIDRRIQCDITVCGETSEAFYAVEKFRISHCPKMKSGGCFECRGVVEPEVLPKGAQEYIGSCMSTNPQLKAMLRDYACKYDQSPVIEILERTTVKEFFCHQKVDRITQVRDEAGNIVQVMDGQKQELMEKRVYHLSSHHPKPGNYRATGWAKGHPKTQQVTFLIETLEPQEDDFESFQVLENLESLRAFQALSWAEKVRDLRDHVTRIYERDEILAAALLTYCSPRWIPFNKDTIRGWLVTAIVGDNGTGKSQTTQRLAEFVNIGDCFSALTGSRTGLSYALVEHKQKGWQVKIGRHPANSRKLLIVDEAQHLPDWDIRTLAKAMEEGFLQIDRVQSKGYESQTRLILIANPRKDRIMDTFSFGCEALGALFPPMIIRRIDMAVFANVGDLKELSFINRLQSEAVNRKITPDMLRAVIYWAWNLQPDQICFPESAQRHCLERAEELSRTYGFASDIPLVPTSDFRNKLARISAAFAVVLVSASDDFSQLIIERTHVAAAAEFLSEIYSHENCGLHQFSEVKRKASQLWDYDRIARAFLKKLEDEQRTCRPGSSCYFPQLIYALHTTETIRRDDLAEQVGCSLDTVKRCVQLLKGFNLLNSTRDGYVKKPKFNKFLRRFLPENPSFLEEIEDEVSEGQVDNSCNNK